MDLTLLPYDIIFNVIIPFTYTPQSKELCHDIKNFYQIKHYLLSIYKTPSNINYLNGCLMRFMYNETFIDFYILNFHYKIHNDNVINYFERLFNFKDKKRVSIERYITCLNYIYNPISNLNIKLGILTVSERLLLIDYIYNNINIILE
jgi:hypothetical protein